VIQVRKLSSGVSFEIGVSNCEETPTILKIEAIKFSG
jgi:hypothetical protein